MNKEMKFYKEIKKLIKENIIKLDDNEIDLLYDKFNSINNKSKLVFKKNKILNNQNITDDSELLGIDLPIWFGNESNKRIMVIGIDPLRNKKTFNALNANIKEDVILGTPYALHDKKTRESLTLAYDIFVKKLSKNNFVYLTDIYKTFFYTNLKGKRIRSYNYYEKTNDRDYIRLLKEEIKLVNPAIIITFGKQAFKFISNKKIGNLSKQNDLINCSYFDNNIKIAPMIHLSNSVRPAPLKEFLKNNNINYPLYLNNEKKGEIYFNIINEWMSNNQT